jgi:uncharacterized RDD family membrane protein YckC
MIVPNRKYAGFWIRVFADFIDSLLLDIGACLLGLMALGCVYWFKWLFLRSANGTPFALFDALDSLALQVLLVLGRGAISLFYYTWGGYRYGTSIGKRIFNIYIVSAESGMPISLKQSLIRCVSYLLSYLLFCAGFLMVAFHPEKRGLHDLIAGTLCVIRKKPGKEEAELSQKSLDGEKAVESDLVGLP